VSGRESEQPRVGVLQQQSLPVWEACDLARGEDALALGLVTDGVTVGSTLFFFYSAAVPREALALLVLALLAMTIPISPFLRARVRRHQARAGQRQ